MTHDPILDAWLNDLDDDPTYSDYLALIAHVRLDTGHWYDQMAKVHWDAGHAHGLWDAVLAVKDLRDPMGRFYTDTHDGGISEAIAAIEALGEER